MNFITGLFLGISFLQVPVVSASMAFVMQDSVVVR